MEAPKGSILAGAIRFASDGPAEVEKVPVRARFAQAR